MDETAAACRCSHCTPEKMGMIVTHFCVDVVFCLLCGRDSGHVKEANIRRTFDFNRILSLLAFPPNWKAALQITVAISDIGSEFRTCGAVRRELSCPWHRSSRIIRADRPATEKHPLYWLAWRS